MKKLIVLLLLPVAALAQQDYPRDITLSWTNADAYVDGTLMEAGDIDSVRVECFRQSDIVATFNQSVTDTGEGQPQSETFTGVIPQPGTYTCFAYTVVVDNGVNVESEASASVSKKYRGKPLPPQSFN